MPEIFWRTPSRSMADGYGYSSYKLREAITNHGVDIIDTLNVVEDESKISVKTVYIHPYQGITFEPQAIYDGVLINNSLPEQYVYSADYVIGFTYWETDTIPSKWISYMDRCDELWTTSEWAGEVFSKQFPKKIVKVFNLGFDTSVFNIQDYAPSVRPFTFLHVGSPSTRKNTQMAVDAFRKVFANKSEYRMIIKSIGPPDARNIVDGANFGSLYNVSNFEIIDNVLNERELNSLYERSHCVVYPTRGEGWGMIPFQSIAKGIPTICTNATACSEFAEMSMPLDFSWSSDNTFGIYKGGSWASPNFDDLCDKMDYVVNNYQEIKDKTLESAKILHEKYSWESVSLKYKDRICQILNM